MAAGSERALVTGASSGIGLAATRMLVRRGARVVALARDAARLERALSDLPGEGVVEARAVDVADADALARAVGDRPLDLVVAAAGVCRQARLDDADAVEVWRRTMATNLDGAFHTLRLAGPRVRDGGAVVVVSSGLGKNARPAYGAYCASKHAVLGLVKAAALELAERRVRVNAICPGWVDTPMSRADIVETARRRGVDAEALRAEIAGQLPLGRPVSADEAAELILFLASPAASAITGQTCNISCGEFSN